MDVRILHVVGDSKFGGASFGIVRLAKFWKTQNWSVEILSTDPELKRMAEGEGVPVLSIDVIWRAVRPLQDLRGLWKLVQYLKRNPYTLVHTHTTKAGFIGRIAASLAGIPLIVHTAHGFAFHEDSSKLKIWFYVLLERIASLYCQKVVTVSRFHASWGQSLGIAAKEKILAISNGVPKPPFVSPQQIEEMKANWGIKNNEMILFTPGRLAPEKGLEDLIEAYALLEPEEQKRTKLLFAGEGALRPVLEGLVRKHHLQDRVVLLGFQSHVPAMLAAADIVVLPTWREGLSIALLEAMSQGCAIITTSIGSNREATDDGQGAFLVSPKSALRLAEAIRELSKNSVLRETLRRRAKNIYSERYTQEQMLSGYHQLYTQLIKEHESAQSVSAILSSIHR